MWSWTDAAVRFYTGVLRGELRWKIHDGGVWVAAVRMSGVGPTVLLASHLGAARDDSHLSRGQR